MRNLIMATVAVAATFATASGSYAQPHNKTNCPANQRTCVQQDVGRSGHKPQPNVRPHGKVAAPHHKDPRVGDNARGGQPFHRAHNSRFKAPPRGQEYRVVDEHLVLVDSKTLKIATVVGLLSALMN